MKIPHQNYILTLIAGKLTNPEILKDLQKNSLTPPPPKEVDDLRDKIRLGQEKYFLDKEPVSINWLKDLGIEAMYGYKFGQQVVASLDGIEGSFKVLNDPNMYRTITALALGAVMPEDIELLINAKYDLEYSSRDLDMFLFYFFNVKGWSRYEKEDYVNNVKDLNLRAFYSIALEEEKDFLMWKLGVTPNKSFDQMLRDMTVDSYYNFKEQSTRNPEQAHRWGSLMLKVQERLDKVEKDLNADSDAKEDLETLFGHLFKNKEQAPAKEEKRKSPFMEESLLGKGVPKIIKPEDLN